ncbi:deoxyhypusine synthase [Candidatus Woesearchaeota archaeon]|nr:deoxyhypusine synthase [Candidatus Woesearchaeota archaeon]
MENNDDKGADKNNLDASPISDIHIRKNMTVAEMVGQFKNSAFQTHNIAIAAEILAEMVREKATIFLSFTSNIAASGIRGIIIDLVRNRKVHALVVSSGALDEDVARAKMPYFQGTFEADDAELGRKGINRMGNILVPNECYGYLEEKISQLLRRIYSTSSKEFTATELIRQIGLNLDTENSFVYHAARNNVPIFCPGVSDGAVGLQLAFFQQAHADFKVNELKSAIEAIDFAMSAKKKGKVGAIILGGGIAKHHTIISNILGGGLDYAIYVNSSSPYHGSLSGATTSEAKSWGKISENARDITVYGDAAVIFPLLIASNNYFFEQK